MVDKKKIDLDVSDDEKADSSTLLKINSKYAERYDKWRNKEELQKCNKLKKKKFEKFKKKLFSKR